MLLSWTNRANRIMARKRGRSEEAPEGPGAARYEVILAPDAVQDLRRLRAFERSQVKEALKQYLRHQPAQTSKARIKRLRGLSRPQYRLRVGDDIRILYVVAGSTVEVLAILYKDALEGWLEREGVAE